LVCIRQAIRFQSQPLPFRTGEARAASLGEAPNVKSHFLSPDRVEEASCIAA
jgi:hypothetical protein